MITSLKYLKLSFLIILLMSHFVVVIVWWLDLQLPMQSVPFTTDVVGSTYGMSVVFVGSSGFLYQ